MIPGPGLRPPGTVFYEILISARAPGTLISMGTGNGFPISSGHGLREQQESGHGLRADV